MGGWGFRAAVLCAALGLWGCEADPLPPSGWTQKDSSGVRVVTYRGPDPGARLPLTGPQAFQEPGAGFGFVRTGAASRDAVFILDIQARQVHRYSRSGVLEASLGRVGEGPGEFGYPSTIHWVGDHLLVLDTSRGRLIRMTADGDLIAEVPMDGVFRTLLFPTGRTRLTARQEPLGRPRPAGVGEWKPERVTFAIVPPEGGEGTVIHEGTFSGTVTENGSSWPVGFGSQALFSEHPVGVAVSTGDDAQIVVADSLGVRLVVRWEGGRAEVTEERWEAARDELIELGQPRSAAEVMFAEEVRPDVFPWASAIRTTPDGVIWAQMVEGWRTTYGRELVRIDPSVPEVHHVLLPRDGTLLAATTDQVVVGHRDSLGVHSVVAYGVLRP